MRETRIKRTVEDLNSLLVLFESHDPDLRYNGVREINKILEFNSKDLWISPHGNNLTIIRRLFYSLTEDPNPEVMSIAGDCLEMAARTAPAYQLVYLLQRFVNNLENQEIFKEADGLLTWEHQPAAENIVAPIGQESTRDHITPTQRTMVVVMTFEKVLRVMNSELRICTIGPYLIHKLDSLFTSVVGVDCPYVEDILYSSDIDLIKYESMSPKAYPNIFAYMRLLIAVVSWRRNRDYKSYGESGEPNNLFGSITLGSPLQGITMLTGAKNFTNLLRHLQRVLSTENQEFYLDYDRLSRLSTSTLEELLPFLQTVHIKDLFANVPLTTRGQHFIASMVNLAPNTVLSAMDPVEITSIATRIRRLDEGHDCPEPYLPLEAFASLMEGLMTPLTGACAIRARQAGWIAKKSFDVSSSIEEELKTSLSADPAVQSKAVYGKIVKVEGLAMFHQLPDHDMADITSCAISILYHYIKFEACTGEAAHEFDDLDEFEFNYDHDVFEELYRDAAAAAALKPNGPQSMVPAILRSDGMNLVPRDRITPIVRIIRALLRAMRGDRQDNTMVLLKGLWRFYAHLLSTNMYAETAASGLNQVWSAAIASDLLDQLDTTLLSNNTDSAIVLQAPLLWLDILASGYHVSFKGYTVAPVHWLSIKQIRDRITTQTLLNMTGSLVNEENMSSVLKDNDSLHQLRTLCELYQFDLDFGKALTHCIGRVTNCNTKAREFFKYSGLEFFYTCVAAILPNTDDDMVEHDTIADFTHLLLQCIIRPNCVPELELKMNQIMTDYVLADWVKWTLSHHHGVKYPFPKAIWTVEGEVNLPERRAIESTCVEFIQQMGHAAKVNPNDVDCDDVPLAVVQSLIFSNDHYLSRENFRSIMPLILCTIPKLQRIQLIPSVESSALLAIEDDAAFPMSYKWIQALEDNISIQELVMVEMKFLQLNGYDDLCEELLREIDHSISTLKNMPEQMTKPLETQPVAYQNKRQELINGIETNIHALTRLITNCMQLEELMSRQFTKYHKTFERDLLRGYPVDKLKEIHYKFVPAAQCALFGLLSQLVGPESRLLSRDAFPEVHRVYVTDHGDHLVCQILLLLQKLFTYSHSCVIPPSFQTTLELMLSEDRKPRVNAVDDRHNCTYSMVSPTIQISLSKFFLSDTEPSSLFDLLLSDKCRPEKYSYSSVDYADSCDRLTPVHKARDKTPLYGGLLSISNMMANQTDALTSILHKTLTRLNWFARIVNERCREEYEFILQNKGNNTKSSAEIERSAICPSLISGRLCNHDGKTLRFESMYSMAGILKFSEIINPKLTKSSSSMNTIGFYGYANSFDVENSSIMDEYITLYESSGQNKLDKAVASGAIYSTENHVEAHTSSMRILMRCFGILNHLIVVDDLIHRNDPLALTKSIELELIKYTGFVNKVSDVSPCCTFSEQHVSLLTAMSLHYTTDIKLAQLATYKWPNLIHEPDQDLEQRKIDFVTRFRNLMIVNYPLFASFITELH